jgi:hypothetical protein
MTRIYSDSEEKVAQRAKANSGPRDRATAATAMVAGRKEAEAELRYACDLLKSASAYALPRATGKLVHFSHQDSLKVLLRSTLRIVRR